MIRTLATALLLGWSASVSAQLPAWTTYTPNNPSFWFSEASIFAVEDTTGFHVWSSYTRAYSHLTIGPNRLFYGQDDSCILIDTATNTAYGYATHNGVFVPLPLNYSPVVPSPNSGAVWVPAIVDGTDVHVFSGLLGTWTTLHFTNTPTVAVARMALVATDGTQTYAVSAHYGTAVPLGLGASSVDAVGYCGAARTANDYHLFSAHHNQWTTVPAGPSATLVKPNARAGYVIVQDSPLDTYYSAHTGTTLTFVRSPSAVRTLHANVAAVVDGNTLYGYSCATHAMRAVVTAGTWTVSTQQEILGATDGTDVYAFGILRGTWERLANAQLVNADFGVVLAQTAPDAYHAFSCLTNAWAAAPIATYANAFTGYNHAVLVEPTGTMQGFSANRGTWTAQAAPPADSFYRVKAAFCARSGNRLDSFNTRTGQWATTTTVAPATVTVNDMAVMADDGQHIYCHLTYREHWSSQPCVAMQKQLRDEMAYAYDGTTIYTWSGSSQISEWANLPEYWRILARGARMNLCAAAEPNSVAFVALSLGQAHVPTPYGTLLIDPNIAATVLMFLPPVGTAQLQIQLPNAPWVSGITFFMQAAMLTPASHLYLTEYFESTIL